MISDTEARQRIRDQLDQSFIVEASAGTGKTTELVHRLVSLLRTGRSEAGRIVAVTFTRKAAGELKLRLREKLDSARFDTPDPLEKDRLERAISELEEARIGTIHSFCADLLRERPVEARVDPGFRELSDQNLPRFFDRVFSLWMEKKLANPSPGLTRALSRSSIRTGFMVSSPLEQIKTAASLLSEWRDFTAPWRREPFARKERIDQLVEKVLALEAMRKQCGNPRDGLRRSLEPLREPAGWIRRVELERARDYDRLEADLIRLCRELNRRRSDNGRGPYSSHVSREEVLGARDSLIRELEQFKQEADADLAPLLRAELWEVVELFEAAKRRLGSLDFLDLLLRTRDLIRDDRRIRGYFQERFSHIFVDEFQDTDPLQAEILLLLSSDDPGVSEWTRARPVQGKLFIVGDPKQSIYRFRRADVILYETIKERLISEGVGLLRLTRSFRSLRPIQETVNAAFEGEMLGNREIGQPDYGPLDEVRTAREDQPAVVALPVPEIYSRFGNLTIGAIEASLPDAVGGFVEWLVDQSGWTIASGDEEVPIDWGHVCILFRRFTSGQDDVSRPYIRALESRRIPHVLLGSRSFHRREEVETVRAALAAIEWPDDELSVYATLRGALFWVPDHLLFGFREKYQSLHPFREFPEDLEEEFGPVRQTLKTLAELHRFRNRRPIVETINDLFSRTRPHAAFALRPAGQQVLGNVQRICDLARGFDTSGGLSFRSFVDHLESEADKATSNESPVVEETAGGVRLMTVHQAKGLEFPVVILADLTCKPAWSRASRYVDSEANLAAFTLLGCAPWELLDHEELEIKREQQEGIRLAYVAATRARDLLVVPAVGDEPFQKGWFSVLNKALYPPENRRRRPDPAAGCPSFGPASVLARPSRFDGRPEFSVAPGLHRPEQGGHQVVWWDPSALNLNTDPNFGLQQDRILAEDAAGENARLGLQHYEAWVEARKARLERGSIPTLEVFSVTQAPSGRMPPKKYEVDVQGIAGPRQVHGPRFGTLVHTVLRDVDLGAEDVSIRRIAGIQARLLGATAEELEAAVAAVAAALGHPLLIRAGAAERCHRELPFFFRLSDKEGVEGVIDLAFLESGLWTVVDFKTDRELESRRGEYLEQLQWYLFALSELTAAPARGYLLSI